MLVDKSEPRKSSSVELTAEQVSRWLPESSVRRPLSGIKRAWLNSVAASAIFSTRARIRLLRLAGLDLEACGVWPHVRFVGGSDVRMAAGVFVNSGVVFDARAHVDLGVNVAVGPGASFITSSHPVGSAAYRAGDGKAVFAPIVIEDGCWIGAGAIVLAGVTIGRGCIVGAGSLVNRDCEPNGLYAGVPARRRQDLPC